MKTLSIFVFFLSFVSSIQSAPELEFLAEYKVVASDLELDNGFGCSVSISNDGSCAIVGAYLDDNQVIDTGSAYIYKHVNWIWSDEVRLVASDWQRADEFGYSVSISTDCSHAIVGARLHEWMGSAYIFVNNWDGTWSEEVEVKPSDVSGAGPDQPVSPLFGSTVSISNDGSFVIVGASRRGYDAGAAYIYEKPSNSGPWNEFKLQPSDITSLDYFGYAVSVSGDGSCAIVGANYQEGDPESLNSGAAYIFVNNWDGSWHEEFKLAPSDSEACGDHIYFGEAVSISSDCSYAMVGANKCDYQGVLNSGSAYIFRNNWNGTWSQEIKLYPSHPFLFANFGSSVSISGDGSFAIVGAPQDLNNTGSVSIFVNNGNGIWSQQLKWLPSDVNVTDSFGHSAAIVSPGPWVIAGTDAPASRTGSASILPPIIPTSSSTTTTTTTTTMTTTATTATSTTSSISTSISTSSSTSSETPIPSTKITTTTRLTLATRTSTITASTLKSESTQNPSPLSSSSPLPSSPLPSMFTTQNTPSTFTTQNTLVGISLTSTSPFPSSTSPIVFPSLSSGLITRVSSSALVTTLSTSLSKSTIASQLSLSTAANSISSTKAIATLDEEISISAITSPILLAPLLLSIF